ncbi:unnamed protein product [Durusdinium trenchii]|uniref:Amino acid transporter transmembrane domain-containing protein n=1 Tax=Durusdinium trenchii TaxID=1381693 RepID=A0ABP0M9L2_9DINO
MTVDSAALLKPPGGSSPLHRKHSGSAEDYVDSAKVTGTCDGHVGSMHLPHCVLNVIMAVLGAGQLTLPYAMKLLGLPLGFFSLCFFTVLSMHSVKTLSIHELEFTPSGQCLESYSELVTRMMGISGSLLCQLLLVAYAWGGAVAFLVILKEQFQFLFHNDLAKYCGEEDVGRVLLCIMSLVFLWPLSSRQDLSFLKSFSWLGCVAALVITSITFVGWRYLDEYIEDSSPTPTPTPTLMNLAAALPLLAFSLNSTWAFIPVLCTLSEKHEKRSRMDQLIFFSNFLIFANYTVLAVCGYMTFGQEVKANIIDSLGHVRWGSWWMSWGVCGAKVFLCIQLALALPLRFFVARKTLLEFVGRKTPNGLERACVAFFLVSLATCVALPQVSLATVLGYVSSRKFSSLVSLIVGLFVLFGGVYANYAGVAVGS